MPGIFSATRIYDPRRGFRAWRRGTSIVSNIDETSGPASAAPTAPTAPIALHVDYERQERRRRIVAFLWAWLGCALSIAVLLIEALLGSNGGPGPLELLFAWAVLGGGGGLVLAIPIALCLRNRPRARSLALVFACALVAALPWAAHWTRDWCFVAWLATVAAALWCVRRSPLRPRLPGPPRCAECSHALLDASARCPECGALPHPAPPLFSRRRLAPLVLPLAAVAISWTLALGTMGPPSADASVEELRRWIESNSFRVRDAGTDALAKRDEAFIRPLLTDSNPPMRAAAFYALGRQGWLTPADTFRGWDDSSPYVARKTRSATYGDRWFGPDDGPAIRERLAIEQDPNNREVLERALLALDPLAWRGAPPPPRDATAAPPAPAVQRMLDHYRTCTSYRDRWVGTRTSTRAGKTTVAALEIATRFDARGGFRWSHTVTEADGAVNAERVCSPDLRVWESTGVVAREKRSGGPRRPETANAAMERICSKEQSIALFLLFPNRPVARFNSNWRDGRHFTVVGQESVDGRSCDVLRAQDTASDVLKERRVTLWVDAQGAIRRFASHVVYDVAEAAGSSTPKAFTIDIQADVTPEFDIPIPAADFDCAR